MGDLNGVIDGALGVVIWQNAYVFAGFLGVEHGPYTGVLLNCLTVGLTGAVTVCSSRSVFGASEARLIRVGRIFACCGLMILFGAVLLRDCFVTLLGALGLLYSVRFLKRPTLNNFVIGTVANVAVTVPHTI